MGVGQVSLFSKDLNFGIGQVSLFSKDLKLGVGQVSGNSLYLWRARRIMNLARSIVPRSRKGVVAAMAPLARFKEEFTRLAVQHCTVPSSLLSAQQLMV